MIVTSLGVTVRIVLVLAAVTACREAQPDVSIPPVGPPGTNRQVLKAQLRVRNVGDRPIPQLVVAFPNESLNFGSVGVGETTEYRTVVHGVYEIAALGHATIAPIIIDWCGDQPQSGSFTYALRLEPYLQAEVVRLVAVIRENTAR